MHRKSDQMRGRNRIRRPENIGSVLPNNSQCGSHRPHPPERPTIRYCKRLYVSAAEREMSGGIKRECPPHSNIVWDIPQLIIAVFSIGTRVCGEHNRLPSIFPQIPRKTQSPLNTAAAFCGRIMKRNQQSTLHWFSTHSLVRSATRSRHC